MCHIPGQEGGALSSDKFPLMQTRSQEPGGVSDGSVWAETHEPRRGTRVLVCKKHPCHPAGTCRGGCELCSSCHKGAQAASEPLFWGCLFFLHTSGGREDSCALPGPPRSALRASREVLPVRGWELPQQVLTPGWLEPTVTAVTGPREHPLLPSEGPPGRLGGGHCVEAAPRSGRLPPAQPWLWDRAPRCSLSSRATWRQPTIPAADKEPSPGNVRTESRWI